MGYLLADQITRWSMPDLTGVEKAILVALASFTDNDGHGVYIGVDVLAKLTGFGTRTVKRGLSGLRQKGYLKGVGWRHAKRVYDIDTGHIGTREHVAFEDLCHIGPSTRAAPAPDMGLSDPLSSEEDSPLSSEVEARTSSTRVDSSARRPDDDVPADWNVFDRYWSKGWRGHLAKLCRDGGLVGPRSPLNLAAKEAITWRMRDGYGLSAIRLAIFNAGRGVNAGRSLTVPWVLHRDKIDAAIADDFDDPDWHDLDPF